MWWRKKPKAGDQILICNASQFEVNSGHYDNGDIFTVKRAYKGYIHVEEIDRPIDFKRIQDLMNPKSPDILSRI